MKIFAVICIVLGGTAAYGQINNPGRSGTVSGQSNGVIPLGTTSTAIGAQSHIDDGVTMANTITSSEPVAASPAQVALA